MAGTVAVLAGVVLPGRCLGRDVIDQVLVSELLVTAPLWDEGWRNDTKVPQRWQRTTRCLFPAHIGGLFHTHDPVMKTAETGREATPFGFWINTTRSCTTEAMITKIDQKLTCYASLNFLFWLQSKRFGRIEQT